MMSNNLRESQAQSAAMINYLSDSINATFGLPPQGPRLQVPQPVIQNAPVTYNHIHVDRSVVGSINTSQVARIDVAMENIQNSGNDEINKAIKALTEAVVNSVTVEDKTRTKLVEQLAFIAEQAAMPKVQQQTSVIKMVLKALPATMAVATDLTTLWTHWGSVLTNNFK